MVGPELPGDEPGGVELVERLLPEADRKRLDWAGGDLAHQGRDRARVDPPAQEDPQGDVAQEPYPDRLLEPGGDFLGDFLLRAGKVLGAREMDVPVGPDLGPAVLEGEDVAGEELADGPENRPRGGDVFEGKILAQGLEVEVPGEGRLEEGFDLRGEVEPAARLPVVERLDPQPVADEEETLPLRVP